MKISSSEVKIEDVTTDAIVVGVFAPANEVPEPLKGIDESLSGAISHVLSGKEFEGELYQSRMISTLGKIPASNIVLVGLGKKEEANLETLRRVSGHVARVLRDGAGIINFATCAHKAGVPNTSEEQRAQAVTEGTVLGSYQFIKYKTVDKDKIKVINEVLVLGANKESVEKGEALASSGNFARDLANEPASVLTPEEFANRAKELEELGVKVTVYDKKKIEELGLTALLAVNRGSVNEPRFVVMEYNGGGDKKVALVGKGITFDSGGLNMKPWDGMLTMKSDMCGAAIVTATVRAAALTKAKVNLIGVFAATENMPGLDAYKQGDAIPTYSGKTIEIGHTDAEGRVVLADALAYTERNFKPDVMVDLATLTGACVVALGSVCAAVMGTDEKVVERLKDAGEKTGERVWQLPFFKEYHEQVKGDIGDVLNIGKVRREAGAITAGAFLSAFVEKTPWAHLDIAGVSWSDQESGYTRKGGTGFGVRLLLEALECDE